MGWGVAFVEDRVDILDMMAREEDLRLKPEEKEGLIYLRPGKENSKTKRTARIGPKADAYLEQSRGKGWGG